MQPALALGQTVHSVIDSISLVPAPDRLKRPLPLIFEEKWELVSGKRGGFRGSEEEETYKKRGVAMIKRLETSPGPLTKKAIKLRQDLPYYWLSEEENIILCGKIDWLIYDEMSEGVIILDFKTGKYDEDPDSLQLPIYYLLVTNCQTRGVVGAKYWYLNRDDTPVDIALPRYDESEKQIMEIGKKIALARKLERFVCKRKDGCPVCRPYELILAKKADFIGINEYNQDTYILA
jgi:hypothetical protein